MKDSPPIYLDHQASCPLDERVFAAMTEHFTGPSANCHSSEHSFGWRASKAVLQAQEQIAAMIGADADEIVFTSGATEANNLALFGRDYSHRPKLITTPIEHKCVLEAARLLGADRGVEVATVEVDSNGVVRLDHLAELVDERTAVVSVIGVHNEIGTVQPIDEIAAIAKRSGASLHLDLAQGPSAIPLEQISSLADTLSLSAHKMYGPMGIGCLYVSREQQAHLTPQIVGGGQQNGLRSGTIPVPLAVGMGEAANIVSNSPEERDRLRRLNGLLWAKLTALGSEIELNGPPIDVRHPGNLNVCFRGYDSRDLIAAMQPNVAASSGSACNSGTEEPSYVLQMIGNTVETARSSMRLCVGRSTTDQQVTSAVDYIGEALRRFEVTY